MTPDWDKLVGQRFRPSATNPIPPAELMNPHAEDPDGTTRIAVQYDTPHGNAIVLERRSPEHSADVVVWGDLPQGVLSGVPLHALNESLKREVIGTLAGERLSMTRHGRRPWLIGISTLVVRSGGGQWLARTRRLVDVELARQNGPAIAAAQTHLRFASIMTPTELTLALLLLHGGWFNVVRGAVSNFTAGDPTKAGAMGYVGNVIDGIITNPP